VTRIAVVDPQPAVRAGLAVLLLGEPGLVPVGAASSADEGISLVRRVTPDVVLLEHQLPDGDGIAACRRLKALPGAPRIVLYTAETDGALAILARVACVDGLVDKVADPATLFEAIRVVARGGTALPVPEREQLDAAAHRVEPEDLPLLAMLVDGTPAGEAADTLHLDRRRVARRVEKLLVRLREGEHKAAA